MNNDKDRSVRVYLDDQPVPLAEYTPPVKITLDTTKLPDGKHVLKVLARSTDGIEGIREVPFVVRNGPAITIVGLNDNDQVDHDLPIVINAYGSERPDMFIVTGSETPAAIPAWVWVLVIAFMAWGAYFLVRHLTPAHYAVFWPLATIGTTRLRLRRRTLAEVNKRL